MRMAARFGRQNGRQFFRANGQKTAAGLTELPAAVPGSCRKTHPFRKGPGGISWACREVGEMAGCKVKLRMTHDEIRILVFALNELRTSLIREGRYTDAVDELLTKLLG